jgi:hypothetical protein
MFRETNSMSKFECSIKRLHGILERNGIGLSPIIVLGMHRSGTTMLAKLLEAAGLFMGTRLSGNHEPRVFQDTNRQIFDYFDAAWLSVDRLPPAWAFREGFTGLAKEVANRLSDDLLPCFFDMPSAPPAHWGFKDPRTSVTAGLFLRLFPDARAIFIHRNAADVAASILTREIKKHKKHRDQELNKFTSEETEALLMRALNAWEIYNRSVLEILPCFVNNVTINYEEVVNSPRDLLTQAFARLGLTLSDGAISRIGVSPEHIGAGSKLALNISSLFEYMDKSPIVHRLSQR